MKQKEIDTLDFMAQCHEIGLKMDRSAIKDRELLITSRSDSLAPLIVRESDLTVLHLEKQQQQTKTTATTTTKQTNIFLVVLSNEATFFFPFP